MCRLNNYFCFHTIFLQLKITQRLQNNKIIHFILVYIYVYIYIQIIDSVQQVGCLDHTIQPSCKNYWPSQKYILNNLAQDTECHSFISWLQTNNGFIITNLSGFIQNVLPTYFKHSNFSSFVRQLNMYGFNKIRNNREGDHIYQHRNFKRGSKSSIKKIQRKVNMEPIDKYQQIAKYESRAVALLNTNKSRQIQKLQKSQIELQKKATSLLQRNRELQLQNQHIIQQIQQQQQRKHALIAQIIQVLNSVSNQNNNQNQSIQQQQKKEEQIPEHQREHVDQKLFASRNFNQQELIAKHQHHLIDNNLLLNTKEDDKFMPNILDQDYQNMAYLSLDDFVNVDYDDLSDMFKL